MTGPKVKIDEYRRAQSVRVESEKSEDDGVVKKRN